ncbi:MAG: prepilin-type N-terminal cleavage/methylation domain-containing protein [Desulfobulbaceae bacterium]|nr:prepilin-type N-terminal cleavage/methylation domain-containing protein [Desulfobulbaceae bacterium]HIJ78341.1 prepilin-type N-terminal cleavage/methylation domain-containing protein [Deltaproteobacteria bacterium]
MTESFAAEGAGRDHGFSLFELLIVLVLLAMIAGVAAPATGRIMDNLSFRRQNQNLLAVLNYARLTAISKGRPVKMTLGAQPGTILLSGAIDEKRSLELADTATIVLEPDYLVFSPAGQATPTQLVSMLGPRSQSYRLDSLSGRPVAKNRSPAP